MSLSSTIPNNTNDGGRGRSKVLGGTNPQNKRVYHKHKAHNRSLSHNKLTKLTSPTTPAGQAPGTRPNIVRSRSTEVVFKTNNRPGLLKRNNRSFSKLSSFGSLQPLTKSILNQSIRSNKSANSLKGSAGIPHTGLRTSSKRGKAIMRLNDDDADSNEYEDIENSSYRENRDNSADTFEAQEKDSLKYNENETHNDIRQADKLNEGENYSTENTTQSPYHPERGVEHNTEGHRHEGDVGESKPDDEAHKKHERAEDNDKKDVAEPDSQRKLETTPTEAIASRYSSTDDLSTTGNLYGGSLLLSQSTGLTKKIGKNEMNTAKHPENRYQVQTGVQANMNPTFMAGQRNPHEDSGLRKDLMLTIGHGSLANSSVDSAGESNGGISFKAYPINSNSTSVDHNIAEPVITNKNVNQASSYQPHQTILNNLKNNGNVAPDRTYAHAEVPHPQNAKDQSLQSFLNQSQAHQHTIETRTQQRLWLQRENSLMDIANAGGLRTNFSNLSLNNLMFAHNRSSQNIREQGQMLMTPNNIHGNDGQGDSYINNNSLHTASQPSIDRQASSNSISGFLAAKNSSLNSIQTKTEFERLNREYLNVRRHLNPIGESLNRIDVVVGHLKIEVVKSAKDKDKDKDVSKLLRSENKNANSFLEFTPSYKEKESTIHNNVNKMWQDAIVSILHQPFNNNPRGQDKPQTQPPPIQTQMQAVNRQHSFGPNNFNNLRSPQTPTTRAVKLAAQAQANASSRANI